MLIIGDVHGKIQEYKKIIDNYDGNSIQLGDFGFKQEHDWVLENVDYKKHKVLFGNHDYYNYLDKPHSLGDYSCHQIYGIMKIRGAYSIDKHLRTEGLDWFANEELSYTEMQKAIDWYKLIKPRIVLSHDCPHSVREQLFGIKDKSLTSNGLQAMFEEWKPDLWVFAHHHRSKNELINGTRFICLAELETLEI